METITSLQNERVKRIVKLQRKATARQETGLTIIEGAREIIRAIENGWKPTEIWQCDAISKGWKPRNTETASHIQCLEHVFQKITYRKNSDGIIAVGPLVGKNSAN